MSVDGQSMAQSLSTLAHRLDESAREHKHMEKEHRIAAQRDRATLERVMAFCRASGVEIVIQQSKGAELNGRRNPNP